MNNNNTYRQELEAAHARIASLENALAEKLPRPTPPPPKTEEVEATPISANDVQETEAQGNNTAVVVDKEEGVRFWQAWPLLSVALTIGGYLYCTGSADADLSAAATVLPFGIGMSLLMVLRYIGQVAADGRSTILDRILFVTAIAIGLPFLIPAFFVVANIGGILIGIVSLIACITGGLIWVFRYVKDS